MRATPTVAFPTLIAQHRLSVIVQALSRFTPTHPYCPYKVQLVRKTGIHDEYKLPQCRIFYSAHPSEWEPRHFLMKKGE